MERSLVARLPLLRAPRIRPVRFPRVRPIAIVGLVLALALAAGAWVWFRSSSFVSVQRVRIVGVSGPDAAAIDGALRRAALEMSTLDASAQTLDNAVAGFPLVRSIHMSTSFPHDMTITVDERVAVAALSAGGARTAVAGDGVVLGEPLLSSVLPAIAGPALLPRPGTHLRASTLHAYLTVLDAAPRPLAPLLAKAYEGPEGLTVKMRNGLLIYFGDDSRPHAKWLSLAAVLANPGSAGAAYIDVRLPERPAAGTETAISTESGQGASSEQSSLVESLDRAVSGGSGQPAVGVTEVPATVPSETESAASESAETESEPAETEATTGETAQNETTLGEPPPG